MSLRHLPGRSAWSGDVQTETVIYYSLPFSKPVGHTNSFYLPFTFTMYQSRSVSFLLRVWVVIYIPLQTAKKQNPVMSTKYTEELAWGKFAFQSSIATKFF